MLNVRNITPNFATELDCKHQILELSTEELEELMTLVARRGVVLARQQTMNKQQQVDLAYRLGEPLLKPNNASGLPSELIRIKSDSDSQYAAGQMWHSDVSSDPEPPSLSMLRMEIVPEAGGDTVFADMYQALETLSKPIQALLRTLNAYHTPKAHYLYTSGACQFNELPTSLHPVVRKHPITGRDALYVNEAFVENIAELNGRESRALLRMLYDHTAYSPNIQCRISWRPGTVVFWDNRCVQHHASFDYFPAHRLGYRITVKGETPLPACSP